MKVLYILHLIAIVALVPVIVALALAKLNAPYVFNITAIIASSIGMAVWAAYDSKNIYKPDK